MMHASRPRSGPAGRTTTSAQPSSPSPPCLAELFPAAVKKFAAGADLYRQGEWPNEVLLLRRGWVYLYQIMEDGRRQIVHFSFPGEILNFQPGPPHSAVEGAQALTEVCVSSMLRARLHDLAALHPNLGAQLASALERNWILSYEHMTNMGRRCARERVANLLLELFCRVHGRPPQGSGEHVVLPLTQTVIGDAVGLTAIHVNRTLRALRDEGIVHVRHGVLEVLDSDRFIELAGFADGLVSLLASASRAQSRAGLFTVAEPLPS